MTTTENTETKKRAKIVAMWVYTGNSLSGHNCQRKGSLDLAQAAAAHWKFNGDTDVVQQISCSRAGVRVERSNFGHVEAYRIVNVAELLDWCAKY